MPTTEAVLNRLENFIENEAWCGYDPYDGLNSRFLRFLTFNGKWSRIAITQAVKRSPINFRPLLGIRKMRNPKAMGLLAHAYIERYRRKKNQKYLVKVREILDWLITNSSIGYKGYSWGYNFDWQSAVFYLPKGVPTVVNTAFIANAFLDASKILKEKNYLDVARSACDFILNDLNRSYCSEFENSISPFCFSYSPGDKLCVHNANLLAAELLARVYSITREEILLRHAKYAVDFTLAYQNHDGSWYYGILPQQKYIDSFHTGFVLVSLKNILNYLDYVDNSGFRQILLKGYEYYKRTFFEDNGMPHYYHNKTYPIDLHCSAQGIITFLKFSEYDHGAINMAKKVATWAIDNMWDNKNRYFCFQKTKYFINKIPYMRWPNAWMFYALSYLLNNEAE